ncbi:MAG TPA: shikimate dehydrogenase [Planctomycetaceae bacterium]|nr:shikimate dehydrogenase [Planctomycetaceae bacterium]
MICVSIGRSRHKMVLAEHRHLVEQGAKMVELRLDYIRGDVNIPRLLADRPCPTLISCRREIDGGRFTGDEQQRQLLLRTAIAEGVDYIDLEEDIAGSIPRFGKTKRVVSLHDFRKTPDDLDEVHRRLSRFDPDIIKIATMANRPHDNVRMLDLVRRSEIPTVGLCMGDIGVPTRILAGRFGAPFTFATFSHERSLAPGQLSFDEMVQTYHYDQINEQTEVYGVIADPIGHSLSPLIHNAAFAERGMNRIYLPMRVPREDVRTFLAEADQLGVKGLSVTIPHKEAVLEMLTGSDGIVQGIGACNTIVFQEGERIGYNTDYRAAMESLEEALGGVQGDRNPLVGKTALVLGAGGVGKAIAFGLIRRGATVILTDGQTRIAERLAARLQCQTIDWPKRHTVSADILINGTPIGMHPNVDETPFPKHHLRPAMVVFDAVYNPESTLLVKDARSRNCRVVTGVDMFVRQACLQFKLFTGEDGPAETMREVIRRTIAAARY